MDVISKYDETIENCESSDEKLIMEMNVPYKTGLDVYKIITVKNEVKEECRNLDMEQALQRTTNESNNAHIDIITIKKEIKCECESLHEENQLPDWNTNAGYDNYCHTTSELIRPKKEIENKAGQTNSAIDNYNISDTTAELFQPKKEDNEIDIDESSIFSQIISDIDYSNRICNENFIDSNDMKSENLNVGNSDNDEIERTPSYACEYCNFSSDDVQDLSKHLDFHDKNVNDSKQSSYNRSTSKNDLQTHMKTREREYICPLCKMSFNNLRALHVHKVKEHLENGAKKNTIYDCQNCRYSTTRRAEFERHRIKHGDVDDRPKFKCPHCTYTTYRKFSINPHISKKHKSLHSTVINMDDSGLKLECNLCSYTTTNEDDLQQHKTTHDREVICLLCQISFNSLRTLKVHQLKNHPQMCIKSTLYECEDCSYSTISKSCFVNHRLVHGDACNRPKLTCHHCEYFSYRKCDLNRHVSSVHSKSFEGKNKDSVARNFTCDLCSYSTAYKYALKEHRKSHNPQVSCPHCDMTFNTKGALRLHSHKCHPDKESNIFQCQDCTYSFTSKRSFEIHRVKHGDAYNGEKFNCIHCEHTTYRKSDLSKHIQLKHFKNI